MELKARQYRDVSDLAAIDRILVEGRQANNGIYYVHTGDVRWWLYYLLAGDEWWFHLYLWEAGSEIVGWSLISPGARAFDVFLGPDWIGQPEMRKAFTWTIRQTETALGNEVTGLYKYWNLVEDRRTLGLLADLGFIPYDEDVLLTLDLSSWENGPTITGTMSPAMDPKHAFSARKARAGLPPGYRVRPCLGEVEVERRARSQHGAFGSETDFPIYVERFQRFMRSPVYFRERDIIAEAPDGRIAAFCIYWLDQVNRVGLLEPVGAHPDFQRLGLGQAVVNDALQRMKASGMIKAQVCTSIKNTAALAFYHSAGFDVHNRLVTVFRK